MATPVVIALPDLFAASRGAVLSPCGRFRYHLWRVWDPTLPGLLLVMLNPSWADALVDDRTVTKAMAIAANLGFGRLDVGNLAAYRSSSPRDLLAVNDPIGPDNDAHLLRLLAARPTTICAWGAGAALLPGRDITVLEHIRAARVEPLALRLTAEGYPMHPLARGRSYIPVTIQPVPFSAMRSSA